MMAASNGHSTGDAGSVILVVLEHPLRHCSTIVDVEHGSVMIFGQSIDKDFHRCDIASFVKELSPEGQPILLVNWDDHKDGVGNCRPLIERRMIDDFILPGQAWYACPQKKIGGSMLTITIGNLHHKLEVIAEEERVPALEREPVTLPAGVTFEERCPMHRDLHSDNEFCSLTEAGQLLLHEMIFNNEDCRILSSPTPPLSSRFLYRKLALCTNGEQREWLDNWSRAVPSPFFNYEEGLSYPLDT